MGFIISLGIKINFLFYPWSARSGRGLELPAWEKTLQTQVHYGAQSQVNVWESHAPSLALQITPPRRHISLPAWREKPGKSLSRTPKGVRKKAAKRRDVFWMPTRHESTTLVWMEREGPRRGERRGRELGDPGSHHFRLSTVPLLRSYLTLRLDAPKCSLIKGSLESNKAVGSARLKGRRQSDDKTSCHLPDSTRMSSDKKSWRLCVP